MKLIGVSLELEFFVRLSCLQGFDMPEKKCIHHKMYYIFDFSISNCVHKASAGGISFSS